MSIFSSPRERQLWSWTALVLVAIYASLGVAGEVAATLRERELLIVAFMGGMLLAVLAVLTQWMKARPGQLEIWVVLGIAGAYIMATSRIASWEERTHLFEYSVVGLLVYQALLERKQHGRMSANVPLLAIVLTALLGVLDEFIQALLPNRVFDIRDIGFNALAGSMAVGASFLLLQVRQFLENRSERES